MLNEQLFSQLNQGLLEEHNTFLSQFVYDKGNHATDKQPILTLKSIPNP
jgi:hypothetical protein